MAPLMMMMMRDRMSTRRDPIKMPTQTPLVPYKPPNSDYAQFVDLNAMFYRERILFISRYINEDAANEIIATLLYLRKEAAAGEQIDLYLNLPGADLRPGLAVYDLICQTRETNIIRTVNLGFCAGMGALLAGAGTKGYRQAMPNSRFLLQHVGLEDDQAVRGQASDIGLEVKSVQRWNARMDVELHKLTGQPLTKMKNDMRRDFYLFAEEAVQYGLIDQVLMPNLKKRSTGKNTVADAGLGEFGGSDVQRYQGQDSEGGWGSQQQVDKPKDGDGNDDDGVPPPMKGG